MLSDKTKRRQTHPGPMALAGGVIVFGILCIAAWYNLRGELNVCPRQGYTKMTLLTLKHQLDTYRDEQGKYPEKLTALSDDRGGMWFSAEETDHSFPQDEWGNRIHYELSETRYELYSWGRDGQPGGIGLDADLYSDGRNREKALPTFWQFFNSPDVLSGDFFVAGILAGCVVCCMIFVSLHVPLLSNPDTNLRELINYTVAIVVISSFVGIALLPLHIPSGH